MLRINAWIVFLQIRSSTILKNVCLKPRACTLTGGRPTAHSVGGGAGWRRNPLPARRVRQNLGRCCWQLRPLAQLHRRACSQRPFLASPKLGAPFQDAFMPKRPIAIMNLQLLRPPEQIACPLQQFEISL
jgi:hypothetical protein